METYALWTGMILHVVDLIQQKNAQKRIPGTLQHLEHAVQQWNETCNKMWRTNPRKNLKNKSLKLELLACRVVLRKSPMTFELLACRIFF